MQPKRYPLEVECVAHSAKELTIDDLPLLNLIISNNVFKMIIILVKMFLSARVAQWAREG